MIVIVSLEYRSCIVLHCTVYEYTQAPGAVAGAILSSGGHSAASPPSSRARQRARGCRCRPQSARTRRRSRVWSRATETNFAAGAGARWLLRNAASRPEHMLRAVLLALAVTAREVALATQATARTASQPRSPRRHSAARRTRRGDPLRRRKRRRQPQRRQRARLSSRPRRPYSTAGTAPTRWHQAAS